MNPMNGYLFAAGAVFFNIVANLSLSAVLRREDLQITFASLRDVFIHLIGSPIAWLGGIAAILAMATWAMTLNLLPLNKAIPVVSLVFVIIPICSHFLYGESLSPKILFSAILIAAGVSLSATAS
jgi:drug/metabolite transporter (DMT)-like permease